MPHYSRWLHYTSNELSGFERLRVDFAQTSFFEGREFRSFKELNILTGQTYIIKAIVPINLILFTVNINLDDGFLKLSTLVGGAEGGTFSETLPIFGSNNMTPGPDHRNDYAGGIYVKQSQLLAGGTHTGGTILDVIRLKSAGATAQTSSVGASQEDERGIAPGTYYFRFENLGNNAITGTFKLRWEERP